MDWIFGYDLEKSLFLKSVVAHTFVPDKFFGCLGVAATAGSRVYKQKSPTVKRKTWF